MEEEEEEDEEEEEEDDDKVDKKIYDTHLNLFKDIYNDNAEDIISDEIEDSWLADAKLKLWIRDNANERKKSAKSGLGYMICISDIYRYSLDIAESVEGTDEEVKYPDMYLLYLYQIFGTISTKKDKINIDETIDELRLTLGIKNKNNNMPDLSSLGDIFSGDKISGLAADIFEKVAPQFGDKNAPTPTREEIKEKTKKLFNSGNLKETISNITGSMKIDKDGKPKVDASSIGDTISSIFRSMPPPTQSASSPSVRSSSDRDAEIEPRLIKANEDEVEIKTDDEEYEEDA